MEVRCFWTETYFVTTFDELPQMIINLEGMTSFKSHIKDGIHYIEVIGIGKMQTYHYKDREIWEFILERIRKAFFVIMFPHMHIANKKYTGSVFQTGQLRDKIEGMPEAVAPNEDQ